MFATLDPTIRGVRLPSKRRVLLSDTVGFIRELPPGLIAAFRATLEEVKEASLILHVSDISDPNHSEHDEEVLKILRELGVEERPRLRVFNKIDRLTPEEAAALATSPPNGAGAGGVGGAAFVSAVTGAGLDDLLARIDEALPVDRITKLELRVPISDGRTLAMIYAAGRVLKSELKDEEISLEAEVPESLARRLTPYII